MGIFSSLFARKSVDFKALVDAGAVIVDVRSPQEYASGHVSGSRNIPLDTIVSQAGQLLSEGRTVITCCRSGARSKMAQALLTARGLEAYNGGAWNSLAQKMR